MNISIKEFSKVLNSLEDAIRMYKNASTGSEEQKAFRVIESYKDSVMKQKIQV